MEDGAKDFRLRELDKGETVLTRLYDDAEAPFLERPFQCDLVERMHREFGHLGSPGLLGVLHTRAWWSTMEEDVQKFLQKCPNCQVSQGSKKELEREIAQHQVDEELLPFERWGIDLISLLPITPNKNRWIITAIDYATGWPIARAVAEAMEEEIARFIHEEIFINYGAPREILSDNGINLVSAAVRHYVSQLNARHRTTTPYHPRTNGKVENLNGTLGQMLTKYLMDKPTRLWDEYLSQALFAARVRLHAVTKKSPFYLLYGVHPRIPADDNEPKGTDEIQDPEERIGQVNHARMLANELLLNRALKTKKIRDAKVVQTRFEKGDWVLIRNEGPEKFQSKWFGPYRVLKAHPLGTYALEEPSGRVLRNLINGARLIKADVEEPERLWSSSAYMRALKKKGLTLEKPVEVRHIVDAYESETISYSELSTITKEEWMEQERTGVRHAPVGEKNSIANRVVTKSRAKARKDAKDMAKRSSGEKGKRIPTQRKRSHTIDSTTSTESVVESTDSQEDMSDEESVNAQEDAREPTNKVPKFDGDFIVLV